MKSGFSQSQEKQAGSEMVKKKKEHAVQEGQKPLLRCCCGVKLLRSNLPGTKYMSVALAVSTSVQNVCDVMSVWMSRMSNSPTCWNKAERHQQSDG